MGGHVLFPVWRGVAHAAPSHELGCLVVEPAHAEPAPLSAGGALQQMGASTVLTELCWTQTRQ